MANLFPPRSVPSTGDRSWRWPVLMATPFLVCLAVLLITGWTFSVFWGEDELNHWALIRWFAKGLPRFKVDYPATATTPLFHLAGAVVVRLFGENLQLVRACNTLLSVGGILVLYGLLRRRPFRHKAATAALLAATVGLSGYYFGYSFRLLTDNMALAGCLLAMGELFRFADPEEPRPLRRFGLGCLWVGLTILTRQSYVFLGVPFGLALLGSALPPRQKGLGIAALALALAPFAALVAAWHGLAPPAYQGHHAAGLIHLYPLALPVMLLGLYAPFFFGLACWRRFRESAVPPRWWVWPAVGLAAAIVVLVLFPLYPVNGRPDLATYIPAEGRERASFYFGGWVYALASKSARLALFHNPLVFWFALPLGGAVAAWFLSEAWTAADGQGQVAALFLLGVLLSSTLNAVSSQKYCDALVLLYLVWRSEGEAARDPWRRRLLYALIAVFCLYTAAHPLLTHNEQQGDPTPTLPPPP